MTNPAAIAAPSAPVEIVSAPTLSDEFGQARAYLSAIHCMAGGVAAMAAVLGCELLRLHKLFGIKRGAGAHKSRNTSGFTWPDLVKRELGISDDTARNYMALADQAKKNLPDFAPVAQRLLETPLGQLPDVERAALIEKTRGILPSNSAQQLMWDWGIAKAPKDRGGTRTRTKPEPSLGEKEDAARLEATTFYHALLVDLLTAGNDKAAALAWLPELSDDIAVHPDLHHLESAAAAFLQKVQEALLRAGARPSFNLKPAK